MTRSTPCFALACSVALLACGDDGSASDRTSSSSGADSSSSNDVSSTAVPTSSGDTSATSDASSGGSSTGEPPIVEPCAEDDGQCIFRFDTFGDEQLWTDVLRLHELVQVMTPTMALAVGLKVDADAVPAEVLMTADLEAPETTVALLELDAVVGLSAVVENGVITSIGITCALCHSTVDDSVAPGIGARLDGSPNRDLDPGAILASTPGIGTFADSLGIEPEAASAALLAWGPGRYDARFNQDGLSAPVLIPPAYGLADVEIETYTGEGPMSYWNAYVAVTQMGAQGNFADPELGLDIMHSPDLVTSKLPALRDYQHSLAAPAPPADRVDEEAAMRGQLVFDGLGLCSSCHSGPAFTDAPMLHDPEEVGADPMEADRSKTGQYRTTPLPGLWHRAPYFHDGSAATLPDVVAHYEAVLGLELTAENSADLVAYLESL